jgi:creatinine amidohydrolase
MKSLFISVFTFWFSLSVFSQKLSPFWEELTSSDFVLAVGQSEGVCLIPIGVIEKHAQQLPLGTDVYTAREISKRAAAKEYCIIYPFYFAGQIFEAKHQPGTIAYTSGLMFKLLDETCREISRNGIKKIILVNGHGGNASWLQYFCQIQLESPRDYAVYYTTPSASQDAQRKIAELRKTATGGHADEVETSTMLAVRPDLVKMERASAESGANMNRLQNISGTGNLYTGIWWYSQYPNHYAGDAKDANVTVGELSVESRAQSLADMIKAVKADKNTLKLQNEFFDESQSPLDTKAK